MGDLGIDTAVEGDNGRYTHTFTKDWSGWGPFGGYVAAVCMRAAGAESPHPRPATFACQFLNVGKFEPVDIAVTTLRMSKRTASLRVVMTQEDRPIASALIWTVADGLPGLEHEMNHPMPDVPGVDGTLSGQEIRHIEEFEPGPMERNFEWRAPDYVPLREHKKRDPIMREWLRFRPTSTFDDPFVDAGRILIALDMLVVAAPNQHQELPFEKLPYVGTSLDLTAHFHRDSRHADWLLYRCEGPVAADGLVGSQTQVWDQAGRHLASGSGHLLFRPNPVLEESA